MGDNKEKFKPAETERLFEASVQVNGVGWRLALVETPSFTGVAVRGPKGATGYEPRLNGHGTTHLPKYVQEEAARLLATRERKEVPA